MTLTKCKSCGCNVFDKTAKRCPYCGARLWWNFGRIWCLILIPIFIVFLISLLIEKPSNSPTSPPSMAGKSIEESFPTIKPNETDSRRDVSIDPSDSLGSLGSKWTIGYQPPIFQRMRASSYGPIAVHGIMDNWSALRLIYSDSTRDIYIEANAIEIESIPFGSRPGFGNIGWRNLLGYVQDGGPFYATVIIDYKDRKILDSIAKSLEGIPHPELLRYRVEQVILDIPNNEMGYAAISLADRDGEMVAMNGLLNKAWNNKIVIPLSESPCFMEVAKRIAANMDKARNDPKNADRIRDFLGGTFEKSSSLRGYTTYHNDKFGYQIDYPKEFVRYPSREDNKVQFHSSDKKAVLVLVGGDNRGTTLMQCYDDNIKGTVGDGKIISQTIKDNWFTIKWKNNIDNIDYINHSKMFVGNQKGAANGFMLSYPEQEKDKYEKMVMDLEKSFIPGDIDRAR